MPFKIINELKKFKVYGLLWEINQACRHLTAELLTNKMLLRELMMRNRIAFKVRLWKINEVAS